jgi:seryl-tRNA synthetase
VKTEKQEESLNFDDGLVPLQGASVQLRRHLDALFCHWATLVKAVEYSFPPVLSVTSLALADYFTSFPHLATLITQIDPTQGEVERFVQATSNQQLTEIDKEHLTSAHYVLPSAACYAVYNYFRGKQLRADLYITVCSPCFRHENTYRPGERQWMFQMREIVCIGQQESVKAFLDTYRHLLTEKLTAAGMPFKLAEATDPFFNKRDPRLMMQRLEPLKHEILYRDRLAISSLNFHRDFFGDRFAICDRTGETAYSGCVAFGLERWLSSCIHEYGEDWENWPAVLRAFA